MRQKRNYLLFILVSISSVMQDLGVFADISYRVMSSDKALRGEKLNQPLLWIVEYPRLVSIHKLYYPCPRVYDRYITNNQYFCF